MDDRNPHAVMTDAANTIEQLTEAVYQDSDISLEEFEEARHLIEELRDTRMSTLDSQRNPSMRFKEGDAVESDHSPRWMQPMTVTRVTDDTVDEHYISGQTVKEYWETCKHASVDADDRVIEVKTRQGKTLSFPESKLHKL